MFPKEKYTDNFFLGRYFYTSQSYSKMKIAIPLTVDTLFSFPHSQN